jgi:putative DNA primase/helicase
MSELEAVHRGQSFLDSLAEKMAVGNLAADNDPDDAEISDADRLARLAGLSPIEYDRQRDAVAKTMSIRSSTLDKMVKELRQEKSSTEGIDFDDVEPWPHPVQPAALLSDLTGVVRRFIICPDETAHAAALWIAMTWFMDVVQVAPLAVITAPEKRCGKSQLLFLLGRLVHRPMAASNITSAALFRAVDAWKPTLLVDEADAFMKDNEELRGLLNCGHTRDSAYIIRVVGDDHTPKRFNVWGAKALAGIGHLADTIMDRSIVLELRRKLPHEEVLRLRHAEPGLFDDLSAKLARFAIDTRERLRRCRPDLPHALHDRAQDNWEPLLAIAEMAGGEWPQIARHAALKLSGSTEDGGTMGNELLVDIREVFESKRLAKISTAELIQHLCDDDEKSWATYNRGRPITPRQVAKKLKEYGIASKNLRINCDVVKGFDHEQFKEAFARYLALSPELPLHRYKSPEASNHAGFDVAGDALRSGNENQAATPKAAPIQGCSGVADIAEGKPEHTMIEVEI